VDLLNFFLSKRISLTDFSYFNLNQLPQEIYLHLMKYVDSRPGFFYSKFLPVKFKQLSVSDPYSET